MKPQEKLRAVSWWLTWNDLQWPDDDVAAAIERRADAAAESGVNCAVIFGTHFRWDYLPLWMNLHDLIRHIADALHKRGILLFDHHSAVLTHRYSNMEESAAMRTFNRHHVPFAPSRDVADTWTFNGEHLNDWRMIDISTGKPVFLKAYTAEEFCINNPGFRAAYGKYVRMLLDSTGIDGLMSDDGCYYSGWTSCGCKWCREKFRREYGHELPNLDDLSFWGNYSSEAFKDWITMRFASTREFLESVRQVVGPDFPLMACCSSSANYEMPKFALTYQEFSRPCSCIMLEMTGDTPSLDGHWDEPFPEQALHLGIAREKQYPCFGLGYGYTESTAGFIWAFNKFLGSSTWFSTLKGRLGLPDSKMTVLKDDTELAGCGYNWEKAHPELFDADTDTRTAVFFSRWTRDYYGMDIEDYGKDYNQCCIELLDSSITFDVVTEIPRPGRYHTLVICSAICLADDEYAALNRFLEEGGRVIASGPVGCRDKRSVTRRFPWLAQFGITCEVKEPERKAVFPPCSAMTHEVPLCSGSFNGRPVERNSWIETAHGRGRLFWTPGRMQCDAGAVQLGQLVRWLEPSEPGLPADSSCGWRFRQFRDAEGAVILHALASSYHVTQMDWLEKQRKNPRGNHLIDRISPKGAESPVILHLAHPARLRLYVPLSGIEKEMTAGPGEVRLDIPDGAYYFVVKITSV